MNDPRIKRFAKDLAKLQRDVRTLARASQGANRSVELSDGPVIYYDEDGNPRIVIGDQGDGTYGIVEQNLDAPPTPTAPVTSNDTSGIIVTWDGTFEDATRPADLSHVEIHASPEGDGFEPTDVTQYNVFTGVNGGSVLVPTLSPNVEHYVTLVAVNRSGLESAPSVYATGMMIPIDVVDTTPTEPPDESPAVVLSPTIGTVIAVVPNTADVAATTTLLFQVSDDVAFSSTVLEIATKQRQVTLAPLPKNTPLWVRVVASNVVGSALPGAVAGPIQLAKLEPLDIADFSIEVAKLYSPRHVIY